MAGDQNTTDRWELPSASEPVRNIVLVGRHGSGKTATANSIIGKYGVESKYQTVGVTTRWQTFRAATPDGPRINLIDTSGISDLVVSAEFISKEIVNCLILAKKGLHAVVLVLSLSTRISQEGENALCTLQMLFGSKIVDYLIVVFTRGDMLKERNMTLEDYLSNGCPEFLKKVLRLCGGRRVVFDNRTKDEGVKAKQVHELLVHVAAIERETGGNPFTDTMHRRIQEEAERVKREEKEIEEKNIADEEKAKLKKQLDKSYSQNMNVMAQMMERIFKESAAANERQMNMMKDFMEISMNGKDAQRKRDEEKREQEAARKQECNIL